MWRLIWLSVCLFASINKATWCDLLKLRFENPQPKFFNQGYKFGQFTHFSQTEYNPEHNHKYSNNNNNNKS